jgi:hypothetical protein
MRFARRSCIIAARSRSIRACLIWPRTNQKMPAASTSAMTAPMR